jgi:fibronectin type 3 domain-containing protein
VRAAVVGLLLLLGALACASAPAAMRELLAPRAEPLVLIDSPPSGVPAPKALRAVEGELRAVPLRWDPVLAADLGGYVVERADLEGGEFVRIAALRGRFRTVYVDRGSGAAVPEPLGNLADGATYRYRVRSFDESGRVGEAVSDEASATTAPLPAPPQGLRAYSHLPRQVALTWRHAAEPSVHEYVIYRSPTATGEFEPIARVSGRFRASFLDERLGDLRVLYYRVAAVNQAGGEGTPSPPARAVTKADPLPPIGLRVVEQRLGANRLTWEPNVERDLAGYRLLRQRADQEAADVVATLEPTTTEAWDEALAADERVTYRVVAFDRDQLESEPSDAIEVRSQGYGLRGVPEAGAVRLSWRGRSEEGFTGARVLRVGWWRRHEIARTAAGEFVDRDVSPGNRYRYQVVLEDAAGRPAPESAIVEVEVPEAGERASR